MRIIPKDLFGITPLTLIVAVVVLTLPCPASAGNSAADSAARFGENKNPEAADIVSVVAESTRKTASDVTDKLAGGYADFLLSATKMMDDAQIVQPAYRDVFLSTQKDTVIRAMLKSYDTFAASTLSAWMQKAPGLWWTVSTALQSERDRLVDFFLQEPELIIRVARAVQSSRAKSGLLPDSVPGVIRTKVDEAAAADTEANFTRLLYRAAALGDTEVGRAIRGRVRKLASDLTDGLTAAYVKFRVEFEATLTENKITDTAVRGSLFLPKRAAVLDAMMKQYDAFAVKTQSAFKGAGPAVQRIVSDELTAAREKFNAMFKAER